MIALDVMPYCEDCRHFDPESNSTILYSGNHEAMVSTTVRCKKSRYCENIAKYLEEKLKDVKNN